MGAAHACIGRPVSRLRFRDRQFTRLSAYDRARAREEHVDYQRSFPGPGPVQTAVFITLRSIRVQIEAC